MAQEEISTVELDIYDMTILHDAKSMYVTYYYNGDKEIKFDWRRIKRNILNYREDITFTIDDYCSGTVSTIEGTDDNHYNRNLFFRGLSSILVILKEELVPYNISPYEVLTQHNLKMLKASLLIQLRYNENKLFMYAIDFVNRWLYMFIVGEEGDIYSFIVQTIHYIDDRKRHEENNNLKERISRIEKILGIL